MQLANALKYICVTDAGTTIAFSAEHHWNTPDGRAAKDEGTANVALINLEQVLKAEAPIEVTLDGIVTVVSEVHE